MTMWTPDLSPFPGPRYRAIADALEADIARGTIPAGFQLPTHRSLADDLGVTVGTITRAYAEAAQRGLIRGETGRGSFVNGAVEPERSFQNPEDIPNNAVNMGLTLPLHALDPELGPTLAKLSSSPDLQSLLRYFPSRGRLIDRETGVEWLRRYGVDTHSDNISLSVGGQHALAVILSAALKPGDAIAVEQYSYPLFKTLARRLGIKLIPIKMDREGMLPTSLKRACKKQKIKALYCMPNCQNPTAAQMSEKRRIQLADIAIGQKLIIVEDEAYGLFSEGPLTPLFKLAPEQTFFIGSLSKIVAAGLRVAYVSSPSKLVKRVEQAIADFTYMPAPLTAEIARRLLQSGTADTTMELKKAEAKRRNLLAKKKLRRFKVQQQTYGYFAWLELPENWNASDFVREAAEHDVKVTNGDQFLVGPASQSNTVRLSLSAPESIEDLERGLEELVTILR
ncbi:PLP-dependent aminotransferase family protein [Pelagicoccus mobilis]|uniref:PLP-dependent aminotransferase family protein n=1 Tax=Pelagicoccus mobilis TaxID=415221 RepID=A0A934VQW2_9BACT|nr:PLP-dependent aminotransferase family protein [Pelagicoccus mobilis]MBK1876919.1 PLP-dependent aminotransferase family protein [Pelagicoccus mobilis]